jgi:hypothetical protein
LPRRRRTFASGPAWTDSSALVIALLLTADHAPRQRESLRAKRRISRAGAGSRATSRIAAKLKVVKLQRAADLIEQKAIEPFTYYGYPPSHWR